MRDRILALDVIFRMSIKSGRAAAHIRPIWEILEKNKLKTNFESSTHQTALKSLPTTFYDVWTKNKKLSGTEFEQPKFVYWVGVRSIRLNVLFQMNIKSGRSLRNPPKAGSENTPKSGSSSPSKTT